MMDELRLWTIYDHPRDMPDSWVARRFVITPDGAATPEQLSLSSADLDPLREAMRRAGLIRVPRQPADDPVILESWL